jgi:hypothetical protein
MLLRKRRSPYSIDATFGDYRIARKIIILSVFVDYVK